MSSIPSVTNVLGTFLQHQGGTRRVNDSLFGVVVFETQTLLGLGVVNFIQLDATQTRAGLPNRHPVLDLKDLLPQNINDLLVTVVSLNDEKASASGLRQLLRL